MGSNVSVPVPVPEDREPTGKCEPGNDANDIAIIGMACRFPGSAVNPEKLWDMLAAGESAWTEIPADRMNIDSFYHPSGARQGSLFFRGAHFLKDDVAAFDAPFFGISAEEAKAIDPQQRFLLEVSYEALENGGIRKEDIDGKDVSVFVGSFVKDYEQVSLRDIDNQPQYAATGTGNAIMSNRLSYFYNINGGSMTVDTGCSASLVGLHQAAETLRTGQASLAIAAGAGMILTPSTMMPMTALNFLSKDGKCFTFDRRANGYGRGEGVGVVVMKCLSDALRDNDPIRAVLRASRINQDGRTSGITHPSVEAQAKNIENVYRSAGLGFDQTGYVECHGTGTKAGDHTELHALAKSLSSGRSPDDPLYVGSIKPNVGHLEGAAGVAGVIKGILVLEKGVIPPNVNFEHGNPTIKFEEWKLKVPTAPVPWPVAGLRRVSVNCFGFGGTNAHAILDQAPPKRRQPDPPPPGSRRTVEATHGPLLFTYAAHSYSSLKAMLERHSEYLGGAGGDETEKEASTQFLQDYAFTQTCRRSNLEWRASFTAESKCDLVSQLDGADKAGLVQSGQHKPPRLCFAFCGQGAQFAQMGLGLMSFPSFAASLREAERYLLRLGSPFHLLKELRKGASSTRVDDPEISQPATTAVQVAVVDLLAAFGICRPDCVVGHSSGEIAAAYAAGHIDRRTAWATAYYRGTVAARLREKAPELDGGMLAVKMSFADAHAHLVGTANAAEVACINSPEWTTLAGRGADLNDFEEHAAPCGVQCVRLPVKLAYHSSHMDLVAEEYAELLHRHAQAPREARSSRGVSNFCFGRKANAGSNRSSTGADVTAAERFWSKKGKNAKKTSSSRETPARTTTMYSSVTGKKVDPSAVDPDYWVQNMTCPVRFTDAVAAAFAGDRRPDLVIEISPRPTLKGLVREILEAAPIRQPLYLTVSRKGVAQNKHVLETVGRAWAAGISVDMPGMMAETLVSSPIPSVLTDVPTYPWDHSKAYWFESHLSKTFRFREHPRKDLIGSPTADAIPSEPRWRGFLRMSENPWLHDHQVQKAVVYPAAGIMIKAIEGAGQMVLGRDDIAGFELAHVRILKAMIVPDTHQGLEVILAMKHIDEDSADPTRGHHEFAVYSKQPDTPWSQNASGILRIIVKAGGGGVDSGNAVGGKHVGGSMHLGNGTGSGSGSGSGILNNGAGNDDSGGNCSAEEIKIPTNTLEARYLALIDSCKKTVVPRQLYEHVDVVGMNYGPTFQNITSLKTNDHGACTYTLRIPDTRSRMPGGFEFPHLIHPATLDAMFHSLFAIECRAAVPTYVERLYVSAGIPRGASDEFHGFSAAVRAGLRDVSANLAMAGAGKTLDDPSVVVEGLHLTDISPQHTQDAGFLPNNWNLCSEFKWVRDVAFARPGSLDDLGDMLAHKTPGLAVLQIGNHRFMQNSRLLRSILGNGAKPPELHTKISRFTMMGGSSSETLLAEAKKNWAKRDVAEKDIVHIMEYRPLGPTPGKPFPSYDIVVSDENEVVPSGILAALNPTGVIVQPRKAPPLDWAAAGRQKESWLAEGLRFSRPVHSVGGGGNGKETAPVVDVLIPAKTDQEIACFLTTFTQQFRTRGVILRFAGLLEFAGKWNATTGGGGGGPCIVMTELSGKPADLILNWTKDYFDAFHTLQRMTKKIMWLTRGAVAADLGGRTNPAGAAVVGLARTLMSEDPTKHFVTFDISKTTLDDALAGLIYEVFDREFLSAATRPSERETEYAEHQGLLYIPRLVPCAQINRDIKFGFFNKSHCKYVPFVENEMEIEMKITKPGFAPDWHHFSVCADASRALAPGEIEVEFSWTVLHTVDLETVMGRTRDQTIGVDLCGTVLRVSPDGSDSGYAPTQQVVAFVPAGGAFRNRRRFQSNSGLVRPQVYFESEPGVGQIIPSCHIAAYYALIHAGELEYSETRAVLVHAGASAYGQAAIQIAGLRLGRAATIFATVTGSHKDKQTQHLIQVRGLHPSRVLDGDDPGFVAAVIDMTGGEGVDVVFDPTHRMLDASLKCVRRAGRVVQLANRSPAPKRPPIPSRNGSVIEVDLKQMFHEKPELIKAVFLAVWDIFSSASAGGDPPHSIQPRHQLNVPVFQPALSGLEKTPHYGITVMAAVRYSDLVQGDPREFGFVYPIKNMVYVLVGGFGGLGISIAKLLAEIGAKKIVFLSRAGPCTAQARGCVAYLEASGVRVGDYRVDICRIEQVYSAIKEISREIGEIGGIVQCAAVIRDSVFDNMTFDIWSAAFRPKAQGSWNIVRCLEACNFQPWLIFLSSSSGVIGNRAQANYAAGNCVQDAIACYWRSKKHCMAVSLDLGPILGAGMLAEDEQLLSILRSTGFFGIRHEDFLLILRHALLRNLRGKEERLLPSSQIVAGVGTGGLVRQNKPADPFWTRSALYRILGTVDIPPADLSEAAPAGGSGGSGQDALRDRLAGCATRQDATDAIRDGLLCMLAKSMNMLPEEMDGGRTPNAYGVDSLVAVSVRSWVMSATGVSISVLEVVGDLTVGELAMVIAGKGGFGE